MIKYIVNALKEDGTGRGGEPTLAELLASPLELQQGHKYNVLGGGYQRLSDKYHRFPSAKMLGKGAYGKVYEVKELRTGLVYACKEMDKVKIFEAKEDFTMRAEIHALRRLGGRDAPPFIVRLCDAIEDNRRLFLILEVCRGSDVEQNAMADWEGCGTFSEADAAAVIRSMMRAVQHCHDSGILYLDVKPQNFLWQERGAGGHLKLTDFGLSAIWDPSMPPLRESRGTPLYMSPEMYRKRPHSTEPDVWGLGICLALLLTGKDPFDGATPAQLASAVCSRELDFEAEHWRGLSDQALDIISRLLDKNPVSRITLPEALEHPWVVVGGLATENLSLTCRPLDSVQKLLDLGPLTQLILEILAASALSGKEKLSLERQFCLADTDGDGKIGPADMAHNLVRRGYRGLAEGCSVLAAAEDIVQRLATQGQSTLSFPEFAVAEMMFRSQVEMSGRRFRAAFELLDMDGDGEISFRDLQAAVSKATNILTGTSLCSTVNENELHKMFESLLAFEDIKTSNVSALSMGVPNSNANMALNVTKQNAADTRSCCSQSCFFGFWDQHVAASLCSQGKPAISSTSQQPGEYLVHPGMVLATIQQSGNEQTENKTNSHKLHAKAHRNWCWFSHLGLPVHQNQVSGKSPCPHQTVGERSSLFSNAEWNGESIEHTKDQQVENHESKLPSAPSETVNSASFCDEWQLYAL